MVRNFILSILHLPNNLNKWCAPYTTDGIAGFCLQTFSGKSFHDNTSPSMSPFWCWRPKRALDWPPFGTVFPEEVLLAQLELLNAAKMQILFSSCHITKISFAHFQFLSFFIHYLTFFRIKWKKALQFL